MYVLVKYFCDIFFIETSCIMTTFGASQARDLVLNSDSEDGLLEDSRDEYMPSDTESDSQLSVTEEHLKY